VHRCANAIWPGAGGSSSRRFDRRERRQHNGQCSAWFNSGLCGGYAPHEFYSPKMDRNKQLCSKLRESSS
jgi:hypothetical protein